MVKTKKLTTTECQSSQSPCAQTHRGGQVLLTSLFDTRNIEVFEELPVWAQRTAERCRVGPPTLIVGAGPRPCGPHGSHQALKKRISVTHVDVTHDDVACDVATHQKRSEEGEKYANLSGIRLIATRTSPWAGSCTSGWCPRRCRRCAPPSAIFSSRASRTSLGMPPAPWCTAGPTWS